jgi:protein tyrosine phosphatase (PTP) superfamily phosphohydrolase (DUF442 family)
VTLAASFSVIDDKLCTSAQPSAAQLAALGETGVRHVINLAPPGSDHAVANEAALLTAQGINYLQIPVPWAAPQAAQFTLFSQVLWAMREDAVLVHCAGNMRASAFVFLYRVVHEGEPLAEAAALLHGVWKPDGVWQDFIAAQLAEHGLDYAAVEA